MRPRLRNPQVSTRIRRTGEPTALVIGILFCGNERRIIFKDDKDRERFFRILAQTQELHRARIYLVCLMPNHFHLLLEAPSGDLSAFMARLLTAYAVYFNRRHHRVGHLTRGRYTARLVEGNDYLLKLSRYIHLNPVCGKRWVGASVEERRDYLLGCLKSRKRS